MFTEQRKLNAIKPINYTPNKHKKHTQYTGTQPTQTCYITYVFECYFNAVLISENRFSIQFSFINSQSNQYFESKKTQSLKSGNFGNRFLYLFIFA